MQFVLKDIFFFLSSAKRHSATTTAEGNLPHTSTAKGCTTCTAYTSIVALCREVNDQF